MSVKYKKIMERRFHYIIKDSTKHKHDFSIKCILEVTNKNIHATGNCYNKKEYYEVLKCSACNSFIPISKEGNINGIIFDTNRIDTSLPLIKANTNQKNPTYDFCNLCDIKLENFK
jgi:hypothetical protein